MCFVNIASYDILLTKLWAEGDGIVYGIMNLSGQSDRMLKDTGYGDAYRYKKGGECL